ncbi:MAG: aminoacyl-tRNA hydrolase, partial [Candidatus Aminicenantes bacterium]
MPRKRSKVWAIIGLGNPGRAYARTRHNAGFLLVRRIARKWGVRLSRPRFQAKIGEITRGGQQILLA